MVLVALLALHGPTGLRSGRFRDPAVVLVYHDFVARRDARALWFDCTPSEFESQIRALRRAGATFVSLDDILARRSLPRRPVALTFADNYRGFLTHAAPILRREGIPATMFAHTGFVGSRVGRPKLTWMEMAALEREGMSFQSQTVSHPADLTRLSDAAVRREFAASRASLRARLGGQRDLLAYPNGKWDARVARLAREAGYRAAFTEAQRPFRGDEDPFRIPRYVHTQWREAVRDAWGVRPGRDAARG